MWEYRRAAIPKEHSPCRKRTALACRKSSKPMCTRITAAAPVLFRLTRCAIHGWSAMEMTLTAMTTAWADYLPCTDGMGGCISSSSSLAST
jgi:hypothetical protein